jgi:hypothetical protein
MAMIPSEDVECYALVAYLRRQGIPHAHIPNSTFTRSWSVKARNKALGVSPGIPDYVISLPSALVWIEMKRVKGGRVSPEQTAWVERLHRPPHVHAVICKGAVEAITYLERIT